MYDILHVIYSIEDVLFLHTFDANGDVDEFREEGVNAVGDLILFPGPGTVIGLIIITIGRELRVCS